MYENTTYEVILQRMLDRIPDKFDKREAYGDTASREFLILRCKERGI